MTSRWAEPSKEAMEEGWKLVRSGITMDDPIAVGNCVGCLHTVYDHEIDGHKVRVMEYDVCAFMRECVKAYKEACRKPTMVFNKVETPFIQAMDGEGGDAPHPLAEGGQKAFWRRLHPPSS